MTLTFASVEAAGQAATALATLAPQQQLSGRELLCYFTAAADKLPAWSGPWTRPESRCKVSP